MNKNLIYSRKIYFSFLFSTFIFFSLSMIILRQNLKPLVIDFTFETISIALSFIPAGVFLYRWKKKKVNTKTFIKLCIIGYIPIIVGFLLSLVYKNYIYMVLLFPIFLLSYLILVPTQNFIEE